MHVSRCSILVQFNNFDWAMTVSDLVEVDLVHINHPHPDLQKAHSHAALTLGLHNSLWGVADMN